MNKTILTYGLLSGLVSALLMTASTLYFNSTQNSEGSMLIGFGGIAISMLVVFMGVRKFRDNDRNGSITFGQALMVALLMTVISCICYAIAWMILSAVFMPDFMDKYVAGKLEAMKAAGKSEAEIQQATESFEMTKTMYKNPFFKFGITLTEPLIVALPMCLIAALVYKRK